VDQGDLEAEIPVDNDYPKTSSLSFRTSNDKKSLLNGRNFTDRGHATKHIDNWGN
jgi:hypothetical protein